MTPAEMKALVLQAIAQIAPEADLNRLDPAVPFRDQFAFDSVDCLNLMNALQKTFCRQIPELDYPRLSTLSGCLAYLTGEIRA